MRKLLGIFVIVGVIGTLAYSFRVPVTETQTSAQRKPDTLAKADKLAPLRLDRPVPQPSEQKKTDTDTQTDAEQVALVNVMKAAIAARHGGVLPKTVSDEDAKAASQAAIKWQGKQAAEKTKRFVGAMK